jgi:hypothetical protein
MSQHEEGLTRWLAESISPVEMFTQAQPIAVGTPPNASCCTVVEHQACRLSDADCQWTHFLFRLQGLACRDGFGGANFYW